MGKFCPNIQTIRFNYVDTPFHIAFLQKIEVGNFKCPTHVPFHYYTSTDTEIYYKVVSTMRNNVENFLWCGTTRNMLDDKVIDPTALKYLKIIEPHVTYHDTTTL